MVPQNPATVRAKLQAIPFELDDTLPVPESINTLLQDADLRLQVYWDQWHRRPIEQYVACDFRDVWRALAYVEHLKLANGHLFCEWGCGFGVVTAMASQLGWESIGIEAESFLVESARSFLQQHHVQAEIWHGNFLPRGSQRLADPQSEHASLFHAVPSAYDSHDLDVDDFAIIFAYPWPGEDFFLREVFRCHARDQAILVLFLGPYQIELYRKLG